MRDKSICMHIWLSSILAHEVGVVAAASSPLRHERESSPFPFNFMHELLTEAHKIAINFARCRRRLHPRRRRALTVARAEGLL